MGMAKKTKEVKKAKKSAAEETVAAAKPVQLKGKAKLLSSERVFESRVFHVTRDRVQEPGGVTVNRDVIRHNGSVVVLAVDTSKSEKDPGILLIRQYRHAAGKVLLELPAGRLEPGEKAIAGAKRELIEETGYRAKKWSKLVHYFASPGFLSEAMNILLAEDLTLGEAAPEEDEKIELHMTPLSKVLKMIYAGEIEDGKTLIGVQFYAAKRKAEAKARKK
jgi:ADP-ribose pyrophosphatase